MLPALLTAAEAPFPWKYNRPSRKSSSLMPRLDATKPAAVTLPVGPMAMPFGLTRNTWPLAWTCPATAEGVAPVTRLRIAEPAPGWIMSTRPPWPTEKSVQFTMARSLFCWMTIRPVAGVEMAALPEATIPPWGRICARAAWLSAVVASKAAKSDERDMMAFLKAQHGGDRDAVLGFA